MPALVAATPRWMLRGTITIPILALPGKAGFFGRIYPIRRISNQRAFSVGMDWRMGSDRDTIRGDRRGMRS